MKNWGLKRGGFRVWRIRVDRENIKKLRKLYIDIMLTIQGIQNNNMRKSLLLYKEAMIKMLENLANSKKRARLKLPPIILAVRFILPNKKRYGDNGAPCIIDLREGRGELRIPSYNIAVPLRKSIVKALIEENSLDRPTFVIQTSRGFVRIIASRAVYAELAIPIRIITIDENSVYGFTVAVWDVSANGTVVLSYFEKLRPPNHGFRRQLASLLQSYAAKPTEETKKQLSEFLPEKILKSLTTEGARELAKKARKKERRLNDEFIHKLTAKMRKLVREAKERGMTVLMLIEPIDPDSLKRTKLQGTLLRTRRFLRNLATYEGATLRLVRASGKLCPRCGSKGTEVIHTKRSRVYQCNKCGLKWERDKAVHLNMLINFFKSLNKEESDDYSTMAQRILSELEKWLDRYQNLLIY